LKLENAARILEYDRSKISRIETANGAYGRKNSLWRVLVWLMSEALLRASL